LPENTFGRNGDFELRIPYSIGLLGGIAFGLFTNISGKFSPISSIRIKKFCADVTVLAELSTVFRQTGADGVYGDLIYVAKDDTDRVIRYWKSGEYSPSRLKYGWMPPHPALYVRRHIYEKAKLPNGEYFDTSLSIAADYDFMTRILGRLGTSVVYLPKVLVKMRLGGKSNRSPASIIRKSHEDYLAIRRNEIGGVGTLLAKNFRKIPQFFTRK
jgi:glycosyltransferase